MNVERLAIVVLATALVGTNVGWTLQMRTRHRMFMSLVDSYQALDYFNDETLGIIHENDLEDHPRLRRASDNLKFYHIVKHLKVRKK